MSADESVGPGDADVPAWAYATVEVVAPDPAWGERGRLIAADLDAVLAPWRTTEVLHIGSTSVPGLAAKPVIDVMVAVRDLADDGFTAVLTAAGWHLVPPELDGRPDERFFVLADRARRLAHLHVMDPDSPWRDRVAFRDALRADPERRAAYASLKLVLAETYANDRNAYTAAKSAFVRETLSRS